MGGEGETDARANLRPSEIGEDGDGLGEKNYVLKLDIEKAFDTVIQSNMGELVMRKVAVEGGMPWEARGWMQLIRSEKLTISTGDAELDVEQTNGIRQGSPDSPVLFASLVADRLGRILRAVESANTPCLPPGGAIWMTPTSGRSRHSTYSKQCGRWTQYWPWMDLKSMETRPNVFVRQHMRGQ